MGKTDKKGGKGEKNLEVSAQDSSKNSFVNTCQGH